MYKKHRIYKEQGEAYVRELHGTQSEYFFSSWADVRSALSHTTHPLHQSMGAILAQEATNCPGQCTSIRISTDTVPPTVELVKKGGVLSVIAALGILMIIGLVSIGLWVS